MISNRKYFNTGFIIISILNVEITQLLAVVVMLNIMTFNTSKFEF